MIDPDENKTPEQLNSMAIMAAFDTLPRVLRAALIVNDLPVSVFRARTLLNLGMTAEQVADSINRIKTREELAAFHLVTPFFARGAAQPTDEGSMAT